MTKQTAVELRALARHYHGLGFNVLPLGCDKHPALVPTSTGTHFNYRWETWQTARQSESQLADILKPAWWVDVCGIGGICGAVSGGLACVDFDLPKGKRGDFPRKVVDRFLMTAGLPSDYPWTVRTPRGGWHVWVLSPDLEIEKGKLDFPAAALAVGHHIEVRFTGHYAALPGSSNVDGSYTWHAGNAPDGAPATVNAKQLLLGYDAVIDKDAPAEQPKGKTRRTAGGSASAPHVGGMHPRAAKAIADECGKVRQIAEGGRNDALNTAAFNLGQLVGAGDVDRATVEAALLDAARACGLDDAGALRTIESGLDAGIADPREPAKVTGGSAAAAVDVTVTAEDAARMLAAAGGEDLVLSERIEADLAEWGYRFTMSELDDVILVNGEPLTDALAAQIRMDARDTGGYGNGKGQISLGALEDTCTMLAHQHRFHPVRDYLSALQWDGKDHFRALNAHFKDKHPPIIYPNGQRAAVFAAWLWRWMAGAVAKVYATGAVRAQTPVLVLAGGQGLGKSTFAAWLASPLPDLFVELPVNPDDKDHERLLASKWLWEVSELGATTRRKDREALKAFFTKADCTFRKPYGKHPIRKPALASFIGTLNPEAGFLVDPTGNRRFLVAELETINHGYAERVDVNQVWAQVVAAYRQSPDVWKLTPEEVERRDNVNRANEIERPFEGALAAHFDIDPDAAHWLPTIDIIEHLRTHGVRFDETLHHGALGATLRGMGLERLQRRDGGARVWGYRGIKPRPLTPADPIAALGV